MNTGNFTIGKGLDPLRAIVARAVVALIAIPARMAANAIELSKQRRKTMLVLVGLILVAGVGFAGAQNPMGDLAAGMAAEDTNAKNVQQHNYTTEYVAGAVVKAVDAGFSSKLNVDKVNEIGQVLAGLGVIVMMTWMGLKTLAAGKGIGDLFAEWTPILVAYGVVQIVCFVPMVEGTIAKQIPDTVDKIGSMMVGRPIGDLKVSLLEGMTPFMKAIYQVMEMKTQSTIENSGFMSMAATSVLTGMLRIVTVIFIVLGMVVYSGVVLFAHVAVKLGALFAPILIPFLIFKPMSGVFMGWVNFMIGASLTKVVAAVMAVLTSNVFMELTKLSDTIASDVAKGATVDAAGADVILFSFAILMSLLCATLMYQAPGIATGLWSGSASGAGFGGIGKAVGGANFGTAPARAAGGAAASGAGWAAGKGIEHSLGAHFARKQAAKDAKSGNVPMGAQRYKSAAAHRAYQVERQTQAQGIKAAEKSSKTDIGI